MEQYGGLNFKNNATQLDSYIEDVRLKGYTIVKNVISSDHVLLLKNKILKIYEQQLTQFNEDALLKINEKEIARCLLKYDYTLFRTLVFNETILKIINSLIGQKYVLSLQNAVLNKDKNHHQGSWHRDLPYQNFYCNEILSVNALYALDLFSKETGGTCVLPYSMNFSDLPSVEFLEKNVLQPALEAGDVLIFNSMLLHRAGQNLNGQQRISVNNQFIRPFIQPQYKFSDICAIKNISTELSSQEKDILGFGFPSNTDDIDWRNNRLKRVFSNA